MGNRKPGDPLESDCYKTSTLCIKLKSSSEMLSIVEDIYNRSLGARKKRQQYCSVYSGSKVARQLNIADPLGSVASLGQVAFGPSK